MEVQIRLKNVESLLSTTADKVTALKGRLEDLVLRAQRITNAAKNNMPNNDMMFGTDLQNFRKELRQFAFELTSVIPALQSIERMATYEPSVLAISQSVFQKTNRLAQGMRNLQETTLFAQHHIRASDHKVHAFYIVQEVEEMTGKVQALPTSANKVVIAVSTPPGGAPPAAPKPAPPGA